MIDPEILDRLDKVAARATRLAEQVEGMMMMRERVPIEAPGPDHADISQQKSI